MRKGGGMIVGIDLSLTATGICYLRSKQEIKKNKTILVKTKERGIGRLINIRTNLEELINNINPNIVVLEDYSFNSRSGQCFSIGELGGVIKTMLYESLFGFDILLIPPTCLKKFVTGSGKSNKEIMMVKTLSKYGLEFTDNNLCDAFGLVMIGKAVIEGTIIKYEQDVLDKIRVL